MTDNNKDFEIDTDLKPPESDELPKRIPVVGMMGLQNMEPEKKKEVQTMGLNTMNNSKRMKKAAEQYLASKYLAPEAKELIDELAGKGHEMTTAQAIVFIQGHRAIVKGDVKSAEFLRDTSGEKPTSNIDIVADVKLQRFESKLIGIIEADAEEVDEEEIKSDTDWQL